MRATCSFLPLPPKFYLQSDDLTFCPGNVKSWLCGWLVPKSVEGSTEWAFLKMALFLLVSEKIPEKIEYYDFYVAKVLK